ncbi:nuclease-related domain-containing protein [Streptomyces filipinensis]|uniref:nuclease-related domain-containing protein n=1 Tax=Streptomyces filipinensis TaxID=66887 RepID=UPI0036EA5338
MPDERAVGSIIACRAARAASYDHHSAYEGARWRLGDRRWPGTRAANVDMLLVGPGGVFVLDVKNWRTAPDTSGDRPLRLTVSLR